MGFQILTTLNLIQKFASLKLPWIITSQLNHSLLNISLTFTGVLAFSLFFACMKGQKWWCSVHFTICCKEINTGNLISFWEIKIYASLKVFRFRVTKAEYPLTLNILIPLLLKKRITTTLVCNLVTFHPNNQ